MEHSRTAQEPEGVEKNNVIFPGAKATNIPRYDYELYWEVGYYYFLYFHFYPPEAKLKNSPRNGN